MISKNPSADEVQRWGPSEVAEWLTQVGFGDCVRFFQDRNVTGAELLTLDESALFRWQDLPIKMRKEVAKQIEILKSRKQEKKSKFSLFSKNKPTLPSKDYHQDPMSPDDDDGWGSDEFDDTLTTMRQESIEWQECLDDNGFPYYWNIVTNETSWDRPDRFMPVDSGTQEYEDEEDGANDYEPPPDDVSPKHTQPPHRRQPMPLPTEDAKNKVLPNPTQPDTRQPPKFPTNAKSARPPPLPSPSTKPESPFTGGPPNFPKKQPHVTSPLASGQKSGAKWPPADASSNVRPSQLKNVHKLVQTSSPPQPSVPKWKQTPPAVPSPAKPAGVSSIASKFEPKQEATPPRSPGLANSKVSGLTSMFEKQNLHLSPAASPPLGGTKSPHRSPRTSTLSVASTTSSSSAASSDSFVDKRASHSSASSASGDSIHDELLPGQRPGGPGGVPPLPGRNKSGAPPPPPTTSIPSIKAKTRDMRSRQLPATPPGGARGPPPPPLQAKKPVPSVPLPEPDPEPLQGGLYEYPWYHGEVEQRQASAALREHGKDGAFLIRKSTKDPTRPYTLALIYQKAIKKVQIRYRPDQQYALGTEKEDEDTFFSIPDLIDFHQTHDILLSQGGKTKLTEAVFKNY
uniref:Slp76 n=1 Tax=Branchiostoma belcheri TaxID=7741 RepID=A0A1U9XQQ1_BRABE|nr:Slp76 [Branchiostoma belcheri]